MQRSSFQRRWAGSLGTRRYNDSIANRSLLQLRFLLSQSTIYSSIIAQQLAKATEERNRKAERATRRKELQQERVQKQVHQPGKVRETRRGAAVQPASPQTTKKVTKPTSTRRKKTADSSSSSDEDIVVTSRRSSQVHIDRVYLAVKRSWLILCLLHPVPTLFTTRQRRRPPRQVSRFREGYSEQSSSQSLEIGKRHQFKQEASFKRE